MRTLNEYVTEYRKLGLSFIPVPFKTKIANNIEWKQYQSRLPSEAEVKSWFNGRDSNVAVLTGKVSGNLVILDCDSQEKFKELSSVICSQMGIDDIRDFTRISQTGKGFHIWLRTKESAKSQKFPNLDIKGEGGYIIAPPSVHPSGAQYQFINDLPIVKVDNLKLIGVDLDQKSSEIPNNSQPDWVSEALKGVGQGCRNDTAIKLVGYFINLVPEAVCRTILNDWNNRNTPPLPVQEIDQMITRGYQKLIPHTPYGINNINTNIYAPGKGLNEFKSERVAEQERNESSAEWGEFSRKFDDFLRENKGDWLDKREVAEQIGTSYKSRTFRKLIQTRFDEGKIRKHERMPRLIMWINRDYKVADLTTTIEENWITCELPLDLHKRLLVPKGSIAGVAGFVSSGKTAFLLEVAELILRTTDMKVYYFFNEMSLQRLKIRVEDFPYLLETYKQGRFKPIEQKDFEIKDNIEPDACNIVDYLRRTEEVYKHAEDIGALQKNIGSGMLWFGLQKTAQSESGYGGTPTRWLSNIYITLDRIREASNRFEGKATIRKAKDYANGNPVEEHCTYYTGGKHGRLFRDSEWHR